MCWRRLFLTKAPTRRPLSVVGRALADVLRSPVSYLTNVRIGPSEARADAESESAREREAARLGEELGKLDFLYNRYTAIRPGRNDQRIIS